MCYSALVNQHAKNIGVRYQARVQTDLFEDLFKGRSLGSGVKIPRALEAAFLEAPETPIEMRIAKWIRVYQETELKQLFIDLDIQEKRLALAEKSLLGKVTKKAQNDQRIATDKIQKLRFKIERIQSGKVSESDSRIWPGNHTPLVTEIKGERWVQPFRYLLRPKGHPATFDRKFNGAYNARRDRLEEVNWWKAVYGLQHGILPVRAFYENVDRGGKNLVLRFEPRSHDEMIVPCIWDRNDEDKRPLFSFALITDEPNPEVLEAGHDRTPIVIKPESMSEWLQIGKPIKRYEAVLSDKQFNYFEHRVLGSSDG